MHPGTGLVFGGPTILRLNQNNLFTFKRIALDYSCNGRVRGVGIQQPESIKTEAHCLRLKDIKYQSQER